MAAWRHAWWVAALAGTLGLAVSGCAGGDDDVRDGGDADADGAGEGGEVEDGDDAEWGWECLVADDCDDGIACTADACDRGLCRNTPDHAPCQDELVCNGREVCYSREGCGPGEPFRGCNDANPCTMDRCVEPEPGMAPGCEYLPLDRDADTYVDIRCGGNDCNDVDPLSNPDATERCFDTFDNDCDGNTDLDDPVCTMDFDNCESPRVLESGVEWEAFTTGATADVVMSCDASSFADVVFTFTLDTASDVLLSVDARDNYAYVALQRTCGDRTSELRCASNYQVSIFERALEAGTYYVVVSSWEETTFLIRLDTWPAGAPAPGDTCDDPIPLTLPARVAGDLTRMDDDATLTCASWTRGADTVYTFSLAEVADVTIDVASVRSSRYVALQSACDPASATVYVCDSGWPFHRTIGNVPAGTYYVWVDSSAPGTYTLDVRSAPPTPPPANDLCTGAIDISAGGTFTGSLLSAADDYPACVSGYRDVAYVFTLAEPKMLSIVVRAHFELYPYTVVTTECGNRTAELVCQYYERPTTVDWRLLDAGTYYVVIEADEEGSFDLDFTVADPVDPCAGLEVIAAGGEFRGSTVGAFDDSYGGCGARGGQDVTYELQLADDVTNVVAEITSASWDTVLYLASACGDPATVIVCNDDYSGPLSHVESGPLAAGTYYLTVDGYGSAAGDYTMGVTITP